MSKKQDRPTFEQVVLAAIQYQLLQDESYTARLILEDVKMYQKEMNNQPTDDDDDDEKPITHPLAIKFLKASKLTNGCAVNEYDNWVRADRPLYK